MSFLISLIATILGAALGIFLALKKTERREPLIDSLDKMTKVFNVFLLVGYVMATPMMWFLAMVSEASEVGFLGVLGWIIAALIWIAPFFFGAGLGLSVLLRKKGKSVESFLAQFAGIAAIAASFLLYAVFVGFLLSPLN